MLLVFAFACTAPPDDADKGETGTADTDTAPPDDTATETTDTEGPVVSLEYADASLYGTESYAVGNAVAFGGDDDGDGADIAVVAASFQGLVCALRGPPQPGGRVLTDADLCWTPEGTRDYAGQAIEGGRDVTGDGVPDLLVGAIANDELGPDAGKVYLLEGPYVGGALADAGTTFLGEAKGDYEGTSLAMIGDVDGDGGEDWVIGAPSNTAGGSGAGRAYLFRGPIEAGTWGAGDAWATVTGEGPLAMHGAPAQGDGVGSVAAAVGDLDGDGLDDLLLGANGNELGGNDAGAAGVFFGPVGEGDHAFVDADELVLGEEALQYVGDAVSGPGDLDGDGLADLLISGNTGAAGTIWVIPGPGTAGTIGVSAVATRIEGEVTGDLAGAAMAGAGDTDGDGWRDLVIGAYGQDATDADAGAAYIVRGPLATGVNPLSGAARKWLGRGPSDEAGRAVAGGGDMDGDGLPDVLVGAPYADTGGAYGGEAYVLLSP